MEPPPEEEVFRLLASAQSILAKEANVVRIRAPVTIVGDLHGQFYDLKELIHKIGGEDVSYLFLGDFVDRGLYSLETLLLLLTLKVANPHRIALLRGNHESRQITQVYGFYDEILKKYGNAQVWIQATNMFDFLPLAAVVSDSRTFAIHGGLSPSLERIQDLELIDRVAEPGYQGTVCDILWSDPSADHGGWSVSPRGAGYVFGGDVVEQFQRKNDIALIARSHQLMMAGYNKLFNGSLTTVWSAPNYMNRCGNLASVLRLGGSDVGDEEDYEYVVFGPAPNPAPSPQHEGLPDYFI